jgi:hypothetical protein
VFYDCMGAGLRGWIALKRGGGGLSRASGNRCCDLKVRTTFT